ncbi:MAG: LysR family transcriptional regulator [Candidatus Limivicinus sp.]|jgi:DNA-binding transcriptional LysR family regulator
MELRQLHIYAAVAKYRSFSGAARKLYISHSSASRAVSELEKELGVRLIERDNRVLGFTPAGEIMAEEAERLIDCAEAAAARVREAGKNPTKTENEKI